MRPIGSTTEHAEDRRINVTPLIDVVMVMIVFFLIVGKLAADERSPIDLPGADGRVRIGDSGTLVVNVGADGAIVLHGETVEREILATRLRAAASEHEGLIVQVRADRALSYGAIEPVIGACRDAGISAVRFAAEGAGDMGEAP